MRGALSLRAVRLGRFSAAVAALLVLLTGQVDPHAWLEGSHEHHLTGGLQELAFDHLHVEESHPDQPLHVEGSASDRHHRCVQCLFQVQSRGDRSRAVATVSPLPQDTPLASPVVTAQGAGPSWRLPARAPPRLV